MKKQIRKLIALFVVMSMVSSFAPASFAEGGDDMFFDFETYYPDDYFADIPGWNASATKSQFTIHSWEDDPDNESWGKSLKYTNGPYNEQARINLNGYYDTVGVDFSFRIDSVSNCVYVDFRQSSGDLYAVSLDRNKNVIFFGETVASYETGVWYDISIVFSTGSKNARLKFKESSSGDWEEFETTYTGTYATKTTGIFFEMFNGAQSDGGVKYFDNIRIYYPEFRFECAYVKSGDSDNANLDETVIFEFNDAVDPEYVPEITVERNGWYEDAAYEAEINGNKIEVSFEKLMKKSDYRVSIGYIPGVFGGAARNRYIEFATSEYEIETEKISVSGPQITAYVKSAYAGGVRAYIVASAYDDADNLTEVKLHPIDVPCTYAEKFNFTPVFDGGYSYIKAMVIKDFSSAVSFSANVSESGPDEQQSEPDENPVAIGSVETDGEYFTVKGRNISSDDSIITIQTLKDTKAWEDLDGFDYESGNICEILAGFDAVSDIGYGDGYSFTSKLVDGKIPSFRIRFGNGMFEYYNPELIESINNAQSDTELEEIIKGDEPLFSGIEPVFENLTTQEQEKFWQILLNEKNILAIEGKEWVYNSDVIKFAMDASVLARLNCAESSVDLENLMYDLANEGYFTCDSYDIFAGVGSFQKFGMSDSQKMSLCSYIFNNISTYSFAQEFFEDFNENTIFYAIKGGSPSVIDKILSESNLIDTGRIPTYFRLNASTEKKVCKELSVSNLYKSLESLYNAVELYSKALLGMGGGASGGGGEGIRGFAMYMQNPDGSMVDGDIEPLADVKLTIQATLITKPGVWYAVVIYDESGKMKQAEIFESEKEEIGEHDFLEIYTKYDPNAIIKILTLDSVSLMKPLRCNVQFTFDA